jgi:antitoxin ParD1/3/4
MPSSYAIGNHFEHFVKQKIESGRYSSASEVIREGLRLLEDRETLREAQIKSLREQILEGMNSGVGVPAEEILNRLEKKYNTLNGNTVHLI